MTAAQPSRGLPLHTSMRLTLLLALTLLLSCPSGETPVLPPGPEDPVENLAQLDAFADRVQFEAMSAAWKRATEPESNAVPRPFGIMPLLELRDDEVHALRSRLKDSAQLQCLQAIHSLAIRMQSESDRGVATARTKIEPLRERIPDLSRMFTDESNLARRKEAWYSRADVAVALESPLRQLVASRNQWAWGRSKSNYLDLVQKHRGYAPQIAEALEAEVRRALGSRNVATRPPWEFELIDPSLSVRMADRFDAAGCLERASFVFQFLGLPKNPPGLKVREAKRTAFGSFAFYAINPPVDQGLTVQPGAGITPHLSAFHEFGHAAMSLLTVPTSCRTVRHPVSTAVAEGCAKIAERLFFSEEWLQSQGLRPEEAAALREWERQSELMRMRSILADIEFERELYQDPHRDVMSRYITIQRDTAGIEVEKGIPWWTLKRHLAFEPLARVDYLLARCAQAAVYRRLRQLPGGFLGAPSQKYLQDQVFRGASALRYEDWFRRATGAEPNCAAWLQDVARVN